MTGAEVFERDKGFSDWRLMKVFPARNKSRINQKQRMAESRLSPVCPHTHTVSASQSPRLSDVVAILLCLNEIKTYCDYCELRCARHIHDNNWWAQLQLTLSFDSSATALQGKFINDTDNCSQNILVSVPPSPASP